MFNHRVLGIAAWFAVICVGQDTGPCFGWAETQSGAPRTIGGRVGPLVQSPGRAPERFPCPCESPITDCSSGKIGTSSSPSGGSVSLYQLSHKVPKAAKNQFGRAAKAGVDHATAIRHLEFAVQLDPNYMEALNNLGSRYILTGQLEKAYDVLMEASKIDPASAMVQTNLVVVLLGQKKLEHAEQAARRAFRLASDNPKVRYILALALYNREQFTEETISQLRSSLDHFPNANIALASVYAFQGKKKEARGLLNGYLAAGYPERATQVRQMLAALR